MVEFLVRRRRLYGLTRAYEVNKTEPVSSTAEPGKQHNHNTR